jgi:glycosyltransferase involved in cell wall biosynthesis
METKPRISVLMPVLNGEKYLASTIDTVLAQTCKDWEFIIQDGGSKDRTVAIAREYVARDSRIQVFSAPDSGPFEAIHRALARAHGEFILTVCSGDGYLTSRWFELCMEAAKDPEISVIWGIPMNLLPDNTLEPGFGYGHFLEGGRGGRGPFFRELWKRMKKPSELLRLLRRLDSTHIATAKNVLKRTAIPQKRDFFDYWLKTGMNYPDGNMCVARKVYAECAPVYHGGRDAGDWPSFYFDINQKGYLSYGYPIPANFAQILPGALSARFQAYNDAAQERYFKRLAEYRKDIAAHPEKVVFRDRVGNVLK